MTVQGVYELLPRKVARACSQSYQHHVQCKGDFTPIYSHHQPERLSYAMPYYALLMKIVGERMWIG